MKRNDSRKLARAAALAAGLAVAAAAHAALDPNAFEVGWPLEVPAQGGYFDIPLAQDVYRHAPALEQLAVLDARNEPMPFYRVPVDPPSAGEQRVTLGVSPLYVWQPGAGAEVSVSTDDRRTSVAITRPADGPRTDVAAFVVDARAVERAPTAVELEWRPLPQPFLLDVRVEQSDDLTSWRFVGRGSVAQLAVGGTEARHARVAVSARAGGYLRIGWERTVADFYVERVTLVSSETAEPSLQSAQVQALDRAPSPSSGRDASAPAPLYFDAGGPVPAATATVRFTAGSGWLTADVAVADSLDGPWLPVAYRSLFYEIDYSGARFASTPIDVRRVDKRYWRVTPADPIDRGRVELELRYPQELLRVAANGSPPYLLAAGTRSAGAGPDLTFAAVWRRLDPAPAPARATLGSLRELGGPAALVEPYVLPWRAAALWAVLVAGVVAVAFMAVRLAREMHEKPSPR
ncbi:MAG TPA: DUF3999 family protein [Gammaproteobacteria bacterium]|nr:DUF3999 family protein [Gammaproteobacteria bacterium]